MATFYNMVDTKQTTAPAGQKNSGFDEHLQTNARVGGIFTNDNVSGRFEYGATAGNANIRLLYGTYNFGSGKLTVGQDYNSYYTFVAQTHGDDNGFNAYGSLWDGRQAQIRVNLNNGLYFAAIQPTGNVAVGSTATLANGAPTAEPAVKMYLPKLNVGYAGKAGAFAYNAGLVGQFFKNQVADKQVNALLGYLNGKMGFGATGLQFGLSYAQNAGNMSFAGRQTYGANSKGELKDALGFEGYVQVSQKISDMISANVGLGYVTDKHDGDTKADDKMSVFVNAPITLAKNVYITPEISYYDEMKATGGTDQAKTTAIGAQFRIDF
jgi:hypothetical protein